jgi:hypothetical protein
MKTSKQISWLKVFIDLWSRAYVSSNESERHQKNMHNALEHFCNQYNLPLMSAGELVDYLKVKRLVEYISKDYQLDVKDEEYMGFINICPSDFDKYKKSMVNLVFSYKNYENLLAEFGLKFQSEPCMEEMIIVRVPRVKITINIEMI